MNVRVATSQDAARVIAFLQAFRAEGLDTVLQHETLPALAEEESFLARLDGTAGVMLVAESAGVITACLTAEVHRHPQLRHGCEFGMAVLKECRGAGLGSRLVAALIEWCESKRLRRIELTVFAHNDAAARLYRRLGFVEEGRKRHAVRIGNRWQDSIQMALDVPRP